jgi:hypothetical protein
MSLAYLPHRVPGGEPGGALFTENVGGVHPCHSTLFQKLGGKIKNQCPNFALWERIRHSCPEYSFAATAPSVSALPVA